MTQRMKQKPTILTIVEKLCILNEIEKDDKLVNLGNEFGVDRGKVYDIGKNRENIFPWTTSVLKVRAIN